MFCFSNNNVHCLLCRGRAPNIVMRVSVCLSVCVCTQISATTPPNFIKFSMHVACGCGSVLYSPATERHSWFAGTHFPRCVCFCVGSSAGAVECGACKSAAAASRASVGDGQSSRPATRHGVTADSVGGECRQTDGIADAADWQSRRTPAKTWTHRHTTQDQGPPLISVHLILCNYNNIAWDNLATGNIAWENWLWHPTMSVIGQLRKGNSRHHQPHRMLLGIIRSKSWYRPSKLSLSLGVWDPI